MSKIIGPKEREREIGKRAISDTVAVRNGFRGIRVAVPAKTSGI